MSDKNWLNKAGEYTVGQVLYVRYFVAVLVDLVVLNLFEEFWEAIVIESFIISLFTAIILQVLLKLTIKIEHRISLYFKSKSKLMKTVGFILMYIVLFIAKITILEVVNLVFGDMVNFSGPWHGVIAFLTVVLVMLIIEQIVVKIYFALEDKAQGKSEKQNIKKK
jgi:hypothetical protein